ncbi:MAG: serine hydrolase domain-containing protein [Acidimicrobiales bacterium]
MVREETARALSHRLATEQSEARLPSVVAALVRDGRPVWFAGAGLADGALPTDETQYRCGSITKTFIAVEVMRLRDEGLVALSDPVSRHIPELRELDCDVANLLSHTSGLRAETSGPWWERTPGVPFAELVASSVRAVDVIERAGRRFHYSNVGFAILGELVARVRGRAWDDVVDDELLRPLGMLRTSTRPIKPFAKGYGVHPHADVVLAEPEHDALSMAPAGQLWTTVLDLCRWSAVLAGLRPEILAPGTAAEMREPLAVNDLPDMAWTTAHGLGLQLFNRDGVRSYGHNGSMPGFLAVLRIEARSGAGVVILTDATSGLGPSLENDLLAILAEREPPAPEPWEPVTGGIAPELLAVTGVWYWGTKAFIVSIRGDGIVELRSLDLGRDGTFSPVGDGTFVGLSGYYTGEILSVVRGPDSSLSHLDIGSFVLSRAPYDDSAEIPGGVDPKGWTGSPEASEARQGLLGRARNRS